MFQVCKYFPENLGNCNNVSTYLTEIVLNSSVMSKTGTFQVIKEQQQKAPPKKLPKKEIITNFTCCASRGNKVINTSIIYYFFKVIETCIIQVVLSKATVRMLLQYNNFLSHWCQMQIFYVESFRHFVKNELQNANQM